jgi:hypothetical protein
MNGSWQAVLARGLAPSPYFQPVLVARRWISPLWLVGAALIAVLTLLAIRHSRNVDNVFAATTLASLLVSPLGWVYYLWLAVPGVIGEWRRRIPMAAAIGLFLLAVPLVVLTSFQPSRMATLLLGSVYSWGTLCVWVACLAL